MNRALVAAFTAAALFQTAGGAGAQGATEGEMELRGVYMELHNNRAFGVYPVLEGGDWRKLFRKLKGHGFNAVFPNVLSPSGACYPSKVVPTWSRGRMLGKADLLKELVAAAHAEGLEIHPWTIEWYKAGRVDKGRLVHDAKGKTHNTLCPSVEANRKLMREMILELVRNYDVDGVQYDYMRLPGKQYCYCRHCREGFERQTGRRVGDWPKDVVAGGKLATQYDAYLCGRLSAFIEETYPLIKKVKPEVVVSAAVWVAGRDGKRPGNPGVRQDWGRWVEKGKLDFIAPMVYGNKWIVERFDEFARAQAKHVVGKMPLVYGLGAYQDTAANEVKSVRAARKLGGSGFIMYTLTEKTLRDIVPVLEREVWSKPAKVPAFGRKR